MSRVASEDIADAIRATLISPNNLDPNWEPANLVDGLYFIGEQIRHLADVLEGQPSPPRRRSAPKEPDPPAGPSREAQRIMAHERLQHLTRSRGPKR